MIHSVRSQIWPVADTAITVAVLGLATLFLMDTFRNLWLNWGWQYPVWSSAVIAFISVGAWWIFGGIIYLSDPSLHKSKSDQADQTPMPAVSSSTVAPPKATQPAVNANGMKLPRTETNKPDTKVVKSGVTNEELFSLFKKGDTSLKVSRALEPYVGMVITIDGKLIQVHGGSGGGPIVLSMYVNNGPGASCVFDGDWLDHLDALKRDQEIKVRGKIRPEPAGNDLQLIECELLESTPVSPPPETPPNAQQQGETADIGGSWAALQKQAVEIARDSAREAAVRTENKRRDRARAVSDLVDRAEERITKDKINYPLFALQRAEAATLHTEKEFLDACEALHHRRFAHPLKSFKDMELDWLKFVRFANKEETDLSNDAEVYKCLVRFRSNTNNPTVATPTDKTELEQHQEWEKDQAEKGISIHLPRSFTPPTAAERQQLANFEQKLVNLRAKGRQLLTTQESPGFDIPAVIIRNLKFIDEVQDEITRLENEQRNPNAPERSLRPIEKRDLVDGLIADGELLVRLWKMRLEPMAASQRYDQSAKWLSNGSEQVSGQHHNDNAMDPADKAMFASAITHAGVKSHSPDYELAIQVASKLEVLRNLRRVFTQLS